MMKWFVKNLAPSHTSVLKIVLEINSLKWEGHQWIAKRVCTFHEKINDSPVVRGSKFICNLHTTCFFPVLHY